MEAFIGVKEASEIMRVRPGTIYYWVFRKLIPHYKIKTGKRGRVLFKRSELTDFINQGRVTPDGTYL